MEKHRRKSRRREKEMLILTESMNNTNEHSNATGKVGGIKRERERNKPDINNLLKDE